MGTGWREVAELTGRAFGAVVVACHTKEEGRWSVQSWTAEGEIPPAAVAGLDKRQELVDEVLARLVLVTEPREGLTQDAPPAVVARIGMAAFVGLFPEPGQPLVTFIGLPAPVAEERLRAMAAVMGRVACRPSCHYWQFLHRFPAAFLVVGEDGRIAYCNPFFAKLGYDPEQLVGQQVTELFPGEEWDRLRRGADERVVNRYRTMVRSTSGDLVGMDFMATMCVETFGEPVVCLTVGCDERLDRQLGHYRRLEAVDRMVSGVAHELNNPLQTVVGNAEMLNGMKLPDAAHRRAGRVLAGARRCQEVVDGLLKLKRKRRGLSLPVDVEDVVRRVARKLQSELEEQHIALTLDVVDPVPAVGGDASDLEQAVENVLRNAFQAVAGATDGEVDLYVEGDERAVRITISDNGEGMSPDVRERAFEPFFTTRAVGAGKGLGLSIALGIVEEHGGLIEIQPWKKGTRVVISLPAAGEERRG